MLKDDSLKQGGRYLARDFVDQPSVEGEQGLLPIYVARRRRRQRLLIVGPAPMEGGPVEGTRQESPSHARRSRQVPTGLAWQSRRSAALAATVFVAAALVGVVISRGKVEAPGSNAAEVAVSDTSPAAQVELVEDGEPMPSPVRFTLTVVEPSYEVQSGDTLEGIARRFSTTVEALQSINNLSDRNTLQVGQKLVIP